MDNELVKKAYEHFGGVWPDKDAEIILTTAPNWNSNPKLIGMFRPAWYGPDGIESYDIYDAATIKSPCIDCYDAWMIACTKAEFEAYGQAEKQPAEKLEQEWLPEVGQLCKFECTARDKEASGLGVIKYLSASTCVIDRGETYTGEFIAHPDTLAFSKFKTEREKFIERAREGEMPVANEEAYKKILGDAYDKGARFND